MNKLKDFWDRADAMAHRRSKFKLEHPSAQQNIQRLRKDILDYIEWENKVVIDYGIGSGHIGHYLLRDGHIKKYIGYDISKKSLECARNEMKDYSEKVRFILIEDHCYDLYKYGADIFISLACIQHFPDEDYLLNFLDTLNRSNISQIVLQIRYQYKTIFVKDAYPNGNILRACQTNNDYILNSLTKYNCTYQSDINPKSRYQYLLYDRSSA